MTGLRLLGPGDEAALEAFLLRHADSSLFLRSNARAGGLADAGQPLQATYAGAFANGQLVGVAAHCWNGVLLLQAPEALPEVACLAASRSGRKVSGLIGPGAQVRAAREALGLALAPTRLDSLEDLFSLQLENLRVPEALASGRVHCGFPRPEHAAQLVDWRVAYCQEALHEEDSPALRERSARELARYRERQLDFALTEGGQPVAHSAFNASLPDTVQVGGVYTPPGLRGRGHGRCVVAGSLRWARSQGVERAVLFTDRHNHPARAAYLALGFQVVGDYALLFFAQEHEAAR